MEGLGQRRFTSAAAISQRVDGASRPFERGFSGALIAVGRMCGAKSKQ